MNNVIKGNWRKVNGERIKREGRIEQAPKADDDSLGVIDPWNTYGYAPTYRMGTLPKFYEDYLQDNIAEYGGDPAAYACAFISVICGVLHGTIEMQTRPNKKENWRNPNDHSLTLGKSGANKSGMFKDLTKHQTKWQQALLNAAPGVKKRGQQPPMLLLQNGSVEGVLRQMFDNKGERLILANDEAMSFFTGAGAHHNKDGVSLVSDAVCNMYDGVAYYKRLVDERKSYTIPKMLGTLIMATVYDNITNWDDFPNLIQKGMFGRMTIGLVSQPIKRDAKLLIPGADKVMGDTLFRLRALRDVRFVLEPEAADVWSDFIDQKEESNAELDASKESQGLVNWCKKYDMRIMSMAVALQACDFVEGSMMNFEPFDIPKTREDEDKVGSGGDGVARQGKSVSITYENLEKAIDFVEGFLYKTQEYFYGIAEGAAEFDMELKNWVARKVTLEAQSPGENRHYTRNMLTNSGPSSVRARNGMTPAIKAKQTAWIRALLDYGFIEVDNDKKAKQPGRPEDEAANYRIRNEFFQKFAGPERIAKLQLHDETIQTKLAALRSRGPLKLGPKKETPASGG